MQNADLHFSAGDLCVYEREFVCVRQSERVFQTLESSRNRKSKKERKKKKELEKERERQL